jgi:ice-binding like protein
MHRSPLLSAAAGLAMLCLAGVVSAQPSLGAATSFAVLGASTVTNTGPTVVTGDLGVSPGSSITGFPPGIVVGGTIHTTDALASQARADTMAAYTFLAGLPCGTNLTGQNLGGLTLGPGVYCFSSSAQLTGTLTLNAGNNPNAVFIFQIGSTLTTASASLAQVINGGRNCNVFWAVGSSATLGTGTNLVGNILAVASVTMTTGANLNGRALAQNGAVTLDTNAVSACAGSAPTPVGPLPTLDYAGFGVLIVLLAGTALLVLRRR